MVGINLNKHALRGNCGDFPTVLSTCHPPRLESTRGVDQAPTLPTPRRDTITTGGGLRYHKKQEKLRPTLDFCIANLAPTPLRPPTVSIKSTTATNDGNDTTSAKFEGKKEDSSQVARATRPQIRTVSFFFFFAAVQQKFFQK